MIVAIHQPDFLPWPGFFAKMMKSDVFVILDHTENNPRDAAFWGRRVRIAVNGQPHWISVPLESPIGRLGLPIREMRINTSKQAEISMIKSLKTFQQSHARTPFYADYANLVEEYFFNSSPILLERNMAFILAVKKILGISTTITYSSSLGCDGRSTELLIQIVSALGGRHYLSGDGAAGYMNLEAFPRHGIGVMFNGFIPPVYEQANTKQFIPGLSIIDMLMNIGNQESAQRLRLAKGLKDDR